MLVAYYDELCKTFNRGLDVLVVIGICSNRMNAEISLHRLGEQLNRCNPQIQILF